MSRVLISFFERFLIEGAIKVTTAAGRRYTIVRASGLLLAIRLTDRVAELRLLSNPALALGELFTEGRLVVTRGSMYDVVALAMRKIWLSSRHLNCSECASVFVWPFGGTSNATAKRIRSVTSHTIKLPIVR